MRYSVIAFGLFLVVRPPSLSAQNPQAMDSLALARQYTQWFYGGMMDSLVAHYDPTGDKPTADDFMRQLELVITRAGREVSVVEEKFVKRHGQTQYWRAARFDSMDEPLLIRWVILPGGYIGGMGLGPLSQAPPIDPN